MHTGWNRREKCHEVDRKKWQRQHYSKPAVIRAGHGGITFIGSRSDLDSKLIL